ncbi:MAG: DUF3604 domain-containing protein [Pseudomonadota bacterium]
MKRVFIGVGALAVIVVGWLIFDNAAQTGRLGEERGAGTIFGEAVPAATVLARQQAETQAGPVGASKQVLFGDLHVHTTYSTDAFLWSLPLNMGKGVHPIADACDYARYCSALDFWSITDHAEASTPTRWQRAKDTIRQCQARAEDQSNPDMVSFIGFEWTQVGYLPEEHFGHKNVIFLDLEDERVSERPIAAAGITSTALRANNAGMPGIMTLLDFENRQDYWDFSTFLREVREVPWCDADTPSDELPSDCFEVAADPGELVSRLESQGLDPLIIPHGSTWGMYTPPGTTWGKQLNPKLRPEKFPLIEIYSGHGNTEEYRDFEIGEIAADGLDGVCPPASDTYTPNCVRAGEIINERCLEAGDDEQTCTARAAEARKVAAAMGPAYHMIIGGEQPEDWLDSGQCTDCFLPAFSYRPHSSVQAGLATSFFGEDDSDGGDDPIRFNWGFIASSDNHRGRPGAGYKEIARRLTTEAAGASSPAWRKRLIRDNTPNDAYIHPRSPQELIENASLALAEVERMSGFWLTGGLAAVHSEGRSREEIWDALQRRETFATSGPRMLLWFDRLSANGEKAPMGATVDASDAGSFRVRAVGSYKQKPGCPEFAVDALGEDRIADLCSGECYNPSDERNLIERIEVVRIRPQSSSDEAIGDLIDDPFLVHQCPANQEGCDFEFTDPDFAPGARDALYYVRAIQEPRPTINAEPIKCERDENGKCIKATICFGDYRSGDSDCTTMKDVRAWSSPIYLSYAAPIEPTKEGPDTDELSPDMMDTPADGILNDSIQNDGDALR